MSGLSLMGSPTPFASLSRRRHPKSMPHDLLVRWPLMLKDFSPSPVRTAAPGHPQGRLLQRRHREVELRILRTHLDTDTLHPLDRAQRDRPLHPRRRQEQVACIDALGEILELRI